MQTMNPAGIINLGALISLSFVVVVLFFYRYSETTNISTENPVDLPEYIFYTYLLMMIALRLPPLLQMCRRSNDDHSFAHQWFPSKADYMNIALHSMLVCWIRQWLSSRNPFFTCHLTVAAIYQKYHWCNLRNTIGHTNDEHICRGTATGTKRNWKIGLK